jgi:peptide/nickel transport system permease protein
VLFKKKIIDFEPESLSAVTWRRFKRNTPAMCGLLIILLSCIVAVLGYLITPDKTPYANDQKPELNIKPPGFRVSMLKVIRNQETTEQGWLSLMLSGQKQAFSTYPFYTYTFDGPDIVLEEYTGHEPNQGTLSRFNLAGVVYRLDPSKPARYDSLRQEILFYTYDGSEPVRRDIDGLRQLVVKEHILNRHYLLGTDLLGRDLLSRLLIGTRISLTVGLISVLISIFLGVLLGALAGYFRGTTDAVISWVINVVWSIPTILLVIAITLVLGKGITQVFIAVGLTMWVEVARIVRGQILSIREKEFIEAGRALGFRHGRIIFRHILPNVMGPVIVMAASNFASAILTEAGLSFLGLGAQPPIPSWGEMINAHHGYILMDKAYLAFTPGIAIMILVLSFMMVGNGLRDALDTRMNDDKPITNI